MVEEKYKSTVSLRRCESYDFAEKKIAEIIEDLGVIQTFKNKKILLKVSLMLADSPEKAINTHPEFVRATIKVIKQLGGIPFVGESSGAYGFTREAFKISGIERIAFEEKVGILNFDALPLIKENINGEVVKEMYLPEILKDMDIFISLPKLKTHRLLLYTGALKNQIGLIPGCQKVKVHLFSHGIEKLVQAIVDLNLHIKFDLAFMDGVIGMQGNGPTSGRPIYSNFLAGSKDLVALDTVCCYIMGIEPTSVLTNIIADQRGLGTSNLNKINIKGNLQEIGIMPFEIPRYRYDLIKNSIYNILHFRLRANIISPYPINKLCKDCQQCCKICPTEAIKSGRLPIDRKKCINCFGCYENCPHGAIKLKCTWFLKPFFKKKLKNFSLDDLV